MQMYIAFSSACHSRVGLSAFCVKFWKHEGRAASEQFARTRTWAGLGEGEANA